MFPNINPVVEAVNVLSNLESITNLNKKTQENFTTKKSKKSSGSGVFAFFMLLIVITYLVAMLITWIRLVLKAATCGIGEGVAAFFLTSIYTMWKMGTLVGKDCNLSQNKGWIL